MVLSLVKDGTAVVSIKIGAVLSKKTEELSVVFEMMLPTFPELSLYSNVIFKVPSLSFCESVYIALHEVPEPVTVAIFPPILTKGS